MKALIGHELVVLPDSEVSIIQREQLNGSSYNFDIEDAIKILAKKIDISLPDGTTKTMDKLINTSISLPFKLGYRWELEGTSFVLVQDLNALGTSDNPIIWIDDGSVPKIDNAYYMIDGIRYVYMTGEFIEF